MKFVEFVVGLWMSGALGKGVIIVVGALCVVGAVVKVKEWRARSRQRKKERAEFYRGMKR